MKEDYRIKGTTQKIELEIEKTVLEKLLSMEKHSKYTKSELANTALKRFISAHKDFLPLHEDRASK